ncbi:MAG TPA: response regulator [Elainellaceae cyanobacterium]
MSINSDIRDHAYKFFIEEAPELLQSIESGILTLRQERDTSKVHSIMRAAHSIKGGSASVGLEAIKTIAHRLETIFKALYSDSIEIDGELENQLLLAYDCLRLPLMEQLSTGGFDTEQALAIAEPIFAELEAQLGDAITETTDFIPSSEDLGISMAQSIFEIDVAEGLDRLATVIENPQIHEVTGELRAQAEVFIGFAELLNLSGFAAIAETALQALDQHPDQAIDIARLALDDFRAGREDVLTKNGSKGGSPSASLLAFLGTGDTGFDQTHASDVTPNLELDWVSDADDVISNLEEEEVDWGIDADDITSNLEVEEEVDWGADADDVTSNLEAGGVDEKEWTSDEIGDILDQLGDDVDRAQVLSDLGLLDDQTDLENVKPFSAETVSAQLDQVLGNFGLVADPSLADPSNSPVDDLSVPANNADILSSDRVPPSADIEIPKSENVTSSDNTASEILAKPRSPQSTVSKEPVVTGLTVRVEADRLNRMNNLLGELTINRNGVDLQNSQLRGSVKELFNRFGRFQSAIEKLRTLSDQMLIAPDRRGAHSLFGGNGSSTTESTNPQASFNPQTSFDSLEMDSYTQLYSQTQTLLEDMVQLEEALEDISLYSYQSDQLLGRHRKMLSQMQDELMWARMIPLGEILNRFPRVLRDLSNRYQKPVNLKLTGTDILVDKAVLTKLYDPLVQLLRNSFDHGIEPAHVRQQQGKPAEGHVEIRARYEGRQVVIEVYDDGQGLNFEQIRDRIVELGWLTEAEAQNASEARLSTFIFEPSFSTAKRVSELSGRGVGLDIVQAQIQLLNGKISVTSLPGQGTTFTLTLPLTLTIINLLICFVGATPLAIRSDSIQEVLIPKPTQVRQTSSQKFLRWQRQEIPAYNLSDLLHYNCLIPEIPPSRVLATVPTPTNWEAPMLVLMRGRQAFALQIDRLVTEQESVVKPFGSAITPPIFAYGCTVLGDGSLIPVIDGPVFLEDMVNRGLATMPEATEIDALATLVEQNASGDRDQPNVHRLKTTTILVVDDSVTLRRTLALSLERAGYRVLQARDGQEAIEQLEQAQSTQLIICDVEMPNMNGFEFLTQRRENPKFAKIPTLMLTSRGSEKHRWLAMKLGAVEYFTKPYLEQDLLKSVAGYIAESQPAELST